MILKIVDTPIRIIEGTIKARSGDIWHYNKKWVNGKGYLFTFKGLLKIIRNLFFEIIIVCNNSNHINKYTLKSIRILFIKIYFNQYRKPILDNCTENDCFPEFHN